MRLKRCDYMTKKTKKHEKRNNLISKQLNKWQNEYTKTVIAAILVIIILAGAFIAYNLKNKTSYNQNVLNYQATADEQKFKTEYEQINGFTNDEGILNKNLSIIIDNNIEYIDIEKSADILKKGSGIIYFGYASCASCRNAIPVLLQAMASSNLEKIYYVNLRPNNNEDQDIRENFTAVKNKVIKTREASSIKYNEILNLLAEYLEDYIVENETGKKINTGKKILNAPTVVSVKNGTILDAHIGTLNNHAKTDGALLDLTAEEETELYNIYTLMITKYLEDGCTVETSC